MNRAAVVLIAVSAVFGLGALLAALNVHYQGTGSQSAAGVGDVLIAWRWFDLFAVLTGIALVGLVVLWGITQLINDALDVVSRS